VTRLAVLFLDPALRFHPRLLKPLFELFQQLLGSIPVICIERMNVAVLVNAGDPETLCSLRGLGRPTGRMVAAAVHRAAPRSTAAARPWRLTSGRFLHYETLYIINPDSGWLMLAVEQQHCAGGKPLPGRV
jgi:hypothetical protein